MNSENYILSIETSGSTCGVAISCNNELVAEFNVFKPNSHDKVLAGLIKKIVHDCDITFSDLKAVALSSGPGSFTGLRIGAAIAKGLCFNNDLRLISVPTLEAIGYQLSYYHNDSKTEIISVIPSSKDLYYFQKFNSDGSFKSGIELSPISEIIRNKLDNEMIGGVVPHIDSELKQRIFSIKLSAGIISDLAYKLFCENKFVNADQFTPLYIQEFIPKIK